MHSINDCGYSRWHSTSLHTVHCYTEYNVTHVSEQCQVINEEQSSKIDTKHTARDNFSWQVYGRGKEMVYLMTHSTHFNPFSSLNPLNDSHIYGRKEGSVLFNDALNTFYLWLYGEREREMFYLTMHSTHFIYGYMASDIWLRTILVVRKATLID